MTATQTRLMGRKDLAELLGVSMATLYRMHTAGKLPDCLRVGIGRIVRYDPQVIAQWVNDGCPPRDEWIARQQQKR